MIFVIISLAISLFVLDRLCCIDVVVSICCCVCLSASTKLITCQITLISQLIGRTAGVHTSHILQGKIKTIKRDQDIPLSYVAVSGFYVSTSTCLILHKALGRLNWVG